MLLGIGGGVFAAPTTFDTDGGRRALLAVGDFNADGRPDLAAANQNRGVTVFLGNGDGSFGEPLSFGSGGTTPSYVAAGDFNGDGKTDLVATFEYDSGQVGVFLGNGDGTFAPATTYSTGGSSPCFVTVTDLNGDGKSDLVVTNRDSGTIGVLLVPVTAPSAP